MSSPFAIEKVGCVRGAPVDGRQGFLPPAPSWYLSHALDSVPPETESAIWPQPRWSQTVKVMAFLITKCSEADASLLVENIFV